jgi:hypothetical protein
MTIITDVNSAGLQPTSPTTLRQELVSLVSATNPGYTADLPGSLIEDITSTDVGALALIDSARVELFNSITPYSANSFILNQLGQIYGVQQGIGSNTSVYVTFTGSPGFVISPGFTVTDGTYQYTVQDGGIIATGGQSTALYCLATAQGSWAVPVGTVTQVVTSVPTGVTLTCTNLIAGIPGQTSQPLENYQAQVIQAGLAVAQGMPSFLKTQLQKVSGVQSNLISVQQSGTNWQVICGGGDPYEVANAIFTGIFDISNLVGSTLLANSITNAYPGVVTTNLNHGYTTGQIVEFTGATGMSGINGVPFVAVVLTEKTFSLAVNISSIVWLAGTVTVTTTQPHGIPIGTYTGSIYGCTPSAYNGTFSITRTGTNTFTYPLVANPGASTVLGYTDFDTLSAGTYTGNGVITPNLRNITVSINNYPDTYNIIFINPPAQIVTIALVWNTISANYVSPTAVAAAGIPAIVSYINSIAVGQPISLFEMQAVFQAAIASLVNPSLISKMQWTVEINGVTTAPDSGTGMIYGDPQSFFESTNALVIVTQG